MDKADGKTPLTAKEKLEQMRSSIAGQKGKIISHQFFYKPYRIDDNEVRFYELIQNSLKISHPLGPILHTLRPHLIPFHGRSSQAELGIQSPTPTNYLKMSNVLAGYQKPALMDIKIGLPSLWGPSIPSYAREGVANLFFCFIHGVVSDIITFKNRVNGYDGRKVTIAHFSKTLSHFFNYFSELFNLKNPNDNLQDTQKKILKQLQNLIKILEKLPGFRFSSASLFIVYEQEKDEKIPFKFDIFLIDFERCLYIGPKSKEINLNSYHSDLSPKSRPTEDTTKPDVLVITALKHIEYILNDLWFKKRNTIYLVRHGERYDYTNLEWGKIASHPHDSPLSAEGNRQAEDIVDRLEYIKPHLIVSAPMQRAILTAEPLARRLRKSIGIELGLVEFLDKNIRLKVPSLFIDEITVSPWQDLDYCSIWGELKLENWDTVLERSKQTVEQLVQRCDGKGDLVIVGHRSTLQMVHQAIMGEGWEGDSKLEYGGVTMFVENEEDESEERGACGKKWRMMTFNETNYLRDRLKSPEVNPFRGLEGYYEDIDWSNYKSSSVLAMEAQQRAKSRTK